MSTHSTHPTAAILIIGNEILSGRTQDTNIKFIAQRLDKVGIKLLEVRIIPDDEVAIVDVVNTLRVRYDYVFTTGGVGSTHDDITAACIAKAFGVLLVENSEMLDILKNSYQERFNENRRRMAFIPEGAVLLRNKLTVATGFNIDNVYCLAGMPTVMEASFTLLLPTLKTGIPFVSNTVTCNLREGDIAHVLTQIQQEYLSIEIGSYPFYRTLPDIGVSFVMHGADLDAVNAATDAVIAMVQQFKGTFTVERFEQVVKQSNGKNT